MGMYTGLRAKVKIKEEFAYLADKIANQDCSWDELVEEYPFIAEFADKERADFVPSMAPAYMPDEWGEYNVNEFDLNTRVWNMVFAIKNYEKEIDAFMYDILTVIAEKVYHMYYHYEEWDIEKQYTIEDGEVKFVRYLDVYTREHRHTLKDNVYKGWGY
ncbi:hypothetical protein [Bacillus thuringiensis]|uniref:hypothetical protein n=1 Tax=Bacillus thuringiensis TaxID=1428 RepID=UPI000A36A8A9|nr:hypothetical protein [Bacillus thuringiensis]OTZ47851.1 hypothetical protein BK762_19385 [Bacillus thuringiensis serovar toumanoffi]